MENLLEYLSKTGVKFSKSSTYLVYDNYRYIDIDEDPEYYIITKAEGLSKILPQLKKIKLYNNPDYEPWGTPEYEYADELAEAALSKHPEDTYYMMIMHLWSDREDDIWDPHIAYDIQVFMEIPSYILSSHPEKLLFVDIESLNKKYIKKTTSIMTSILKKR